MNPYEQEYCEEWDEENKRCLKDNPEECWYYRIGKCRW